MASIDARLGYTERMGTIINYPANGDTFSGYLAPAKAPSPGVIVIQEYWGLVDHIKNLADRFAEAGFTALAPDFYHGEIAEEPDAASAKMMALEVPTAAKVIQGAIDALLDSEHTIGKNVGVVGFCMGGQLALFSAGLDQRVAACANFYGIHPDVKPDFGAMSAPVLGIFAERDHLTTPEKVAELDKTLTANGVPHEFHTYPGLDHAFFNDERPEVYDEEAAADAWQKVMAFFENNLRRPIAG